MNEELTRQFLNACHESRRICELLPDLPPRIKPRHIRTQLRMCRGLCSSPSGGGCQRS